MKRESPNAQRPRFTGQSSEKSPDDDDSAFNETLKRMLKTPPAPKQAGKPVDKDKPPYPAKKP